MFSSNKILDDGSKGTFFKYVRSGGEGGCHENADRIVQRGRGGLQNAYIRN